MDLNFQIITGIIFVRESKGCEMVFLNFRESYGGKKWGKDNKKFRTSGFPWCHRKGR